MGILFEFADAGDVDLNEIQTELNHFEAKIVRLLYLI